MTAAKRLTDQGCSASRVCDALSMPRSTYYGNLRPRSFGRDRPQSAPANRLSEEEIQAIKSVLHEERFIVSVKISTSRPGL
jgi:hypothetical protein